MAVFLMKTRIHYRISRKDFLTPDKGLEARFLVVSSHLRCICT
jgi:hypothetical protein